jgi:DNA-binding NarL/FixJ family response regulator
MLGIETIHVLLADDRSAVRELLRETLNREPDIDVVGAVETERSCHLAQILKPRIVVLHIQTPADGINILVALKQLDPHLSVVVLTAHNSKALFTEAIRVGANGYVIENTSHEMIVLAIRTALAGGTLVEGPVLEHTLRERNTLATGGSELDAVHITSSLTPRELDILHLLARGYRNRAISDELHLAEVTVKKHVQNVVSKLGVSDRARAGLLAARLGLDV